MTRNGAATHRPGTYRRAWRHVEIELHPIAAGIAGAALLGLLAWSTAATSYAFFRDDVLREILRRHAVAEAAQQERILALTSEVERLTERNIIERTTLGEALDGLMRRQAQLERQQDTLAAIARGTGSDAPGGEKTATGDARRPAPPAPADTLRLDRAPEPRRESRLMPSERQALALPTDTPHAARLAGVAANIAALETQQAQMLSSMEERLEREHRTLSDVYAWLGVKPSQAAAKAGVGGPFVPVSGAASSPFERSLLRLATVRAEVWRLRTGLDTMPVRHPLPGAEQSSGFGTRQDPFLRALAFHSGIDFRGEQGEPVKTTAAGVVTEAGWSGGYGNMVEVDHGNGLSTRYGHLSAIRVSVGEKVSTGTVVGLLGSTGRSTGPHLHYETRVDGEAVDPERFLMVAEKLAR